MEDLEDNVEDISQKVEQEGQGDGKQQMKKKKFRRFNKSSNFQTRKWRE